MMIDSSRRRTPRRAGHLGLLLLGVLALCGAGPPSFADEDPLFGRLPGFLEEFYGPDFARRQDLLELIRAVQTRIASESSISGISPGGFSFEVGPLGLPTKTSSSLGTIWTTGADPLGQGRLSVGASYTYLEFDSFGGRSLNRLLDSALSSPPLDVNLEMRTHIVGLSALYGVNEDWEAGVFVPLVFHEANSDVFRGQQLLFSTGGRSEGLGDVMLLSKYRLASGEDWTWSLGGQLKTPTGDEDRHLGTGKTDALLQSLFTKRWNDLEANLDFGYRWNGYGRDYDLLRYRAGVAYSLTSHVNLLGELVGSYSEEEIFDTVDGGLGLKINPTGGLVIQAGVRFPLDDDGLRADVIPNVGLEWRF